MTDTRSNTSSSSIAPVRWRRAEQSLPHIFSDVRPRSCSARKRWCSWRPTVSRDGSPSMTGRSWPRRPMASALVSSGDDGQVIATNAQGDTRTLASDAKHRSIDHVALAPDGAVAWSAGKTAFVQAKELREFDAPSTVGGLAFLHKGLWAGGCPFQRRLALVPQCAAGCAGKARMEGLASRRHGEPRRPLPRHHHAGADAARLAARRPPAHAHVRLRGARGLRSAGPSAGAGWQPLARHSSSSGRSGPRTGPWANSRGCWLPPNTASRSSPATPARTSSPPATPTAWCFVPCRGWRRDFQRKAGRRAGHRAGLERRRPPPRLRHGKRRGRIDRPRLTLRSHTAAAAGSR